MKLIKDKIKVTIVIVSLVIISFLVGLYLKTMKNSYISNMEQYYDIVIKIKEERIKEIVNRTIADIELERKKTFQEYKAIVDRVVNIFGISISGDQSISIDEQIKYIINIFFENKTIKYIVIDNETRIVIESNEVEFKTGQVVLETTFEQKDIYEYCVKKQFNNKTVVVGVKKEDIDNKIKKRVEERVKNVQLDKENYIWIEEIINYEGGDKFGKVIVNGGIPEIEGKYISTSELDINGAKFYEEMLNNINEFGESITEYYFYKNGTKEIAPIKSYGKLYKEYNWVINTGVYLDDVESFIVSGVKEYKKRIKIYILFTIIITILMILIISLLEGMILKDYERKKRLLIKRENEIMKDHYIILEKKYDKINKIVHDFKNHLLVIRGLINENMDLQAIRYIETIHSGFKDISQDIISKNKIIDIILNEKIILMKDENIEFRHDIEYINLDYINNNDIGIIVGNMLDNAIESCRKSEQKLIIFKMYEFNNRFVVITCENSCDYEPKLKNGNLVTTKKNTDIHGYGINNIENVLEKYGGNMSWNYDNKNKMFKFAIMIPCKNKN